MSTVLLKKKLADSSAQDGLLKCKACHVECRDSIRLDPCCCVLCKDCMISFLAQGRMQLNPLCCVCQMGVTSHIHVRQSSGGEVKVEEFLYHGNKKKKRGAGDDTHGLQGGDGSKKRVKTTHVKRKTFEDRLRDLQEFKNENGHCYVPYRYPQNQSLADWVKVVRRGRLKRTAEERAKLTEIGFVWETRRSRDERMWGVMFDELQKFKDIHGHCAVPFSYPDKKLMEWVHTQRKLYNKNDLNEERKHQLNDIGMVWVAAKFHGRSTGTRTTSPKKKLSQPSEENDNNDNNIIDNNSMSTKQLLGQLRLPEHQPQPLQNMGQIPLGVQQQPMMQQHQQPPFMPQHQQQQPQPQMHQQQPHMIQMQQQQQQDLPTEPQPLLMPQQQQQQHDHQPVPMGMPQEQQERQQQPQMLQQQPPHQQQHSPMMQQQQQQQQQPMMQQQQQQGGFRNHQAFNPFGYMM